MCTEKKITSTIMAFVGGLLMFGWVFSSCNLTDYEMDYLQKTVITENYSKDMQEYIGATYEDYKYYIS